MLKSINTGSECTCKYIVLVCACIKNHTCIHNTCYLTPSVFGYKGNKICNVSLVVAITRSFAHKCELTTGHEVISINRKHEMAREYQQIRRYSRKYLTPSGPFCREMTESTDTKNSMGMKPHYIVLLWV